MHTPCSGCWGTLAWRRRCSVCGRSSRRLRPPPSCKQARARPRLLLGLRRWRQPWLACSVQRQREMRRPLPPRARRCSRLRRGTFCWQGTCRPPRACCCWSLLPTSGALQRWPLLPRASKPAGGAVLLGAWCSGWLPSAEPVCRPLQPRASRQPGGVGSAASAATAGLVRGWKPGGRSGARRSASCWSCSGGVQPLACRWVHWERVAGRGQEAAYCGTPRMC